MPFNFTVVPSSQVQQKTAAKKAAPAKSPAAKSAATARRRTTVTVASYGGKLFEPVMAREKPIAVHFLPEMIQDKETIIRFSDDGFFAVKYFLLERRCYLVHFINPINPTTQTTLDSAFAEAINYKIFEFVDEPEYILATTMKDKEGLYANIEKVMRLRSQSALGKLENKVREILRDKINADKFLKRKKEFERQDLDWQRELARQNRIEEEEEKKRLEETAIVEQATETIEVKEAKEPQPLVIEEKVKVEEPKPQTVIEPPKPTKPASSSFWGKKL